MVDFYPDEQKDVSKFNPAAYKMSRIHYFSGIADESNMNPEGWNAEWNTINCIAQFRATNIIYKECKAKFAKDEKEECEKLMKQIDDAIKKFPLYFKNGKKIILYSARISIVLPYIDRYETIIRKYQDEHGLDTPNIEDDMGL